MSLRIARRAEVYFDSEKCANYVLNPEWMSAPLELVDVRRGESYLVVGPYRFRAKDLKQVQQYARDYDWDGLSSLSLPKLIPKPQ